MNHGAEPKLISKLEVLNKVCLTYPTIWDWMRKGKFPRSRQLGGKVCWLESEINEWIVNRPIQPLKGDPEQNGEAALPMQQTKGRGGANRKALAGERGKHQTPASSDERKSPPPERESLISGVKGQ